MIESLVDAGITGYILKDDWKSIHQLAKIVPAIAKGGTYFSPEVYQTLREAKAVSKKPILTPRQLEALSLCAAYPDESTRQLAQRLLVADSTLRNLLSSAYLKLGCNTRTSAISMIRRLGLLPSFPPEIKTKF